MFFGNVGDDKSVVGDKSNPSFLFNIQKTFTWPSLSTLRVKEINHSSFFKKPLLSQKDRKKL